MGLYIGTSFAVNNDGISHKSFQSIGINTNFEFVGFATNPSPSSGGEFVSTVVALGSGRIVVGDDSNDDLALNAGKAYIFDLDGNEVGILTGSGGENDGFGRSVAVGSGRIVVGEPNARKAHIFDLDGNKLNTITEGSTTFGVSVDIRNKKIAVGARFNDEIYLYDLDGNNGLNIEPGVNGSTGYSVAIGYDRVVIGSPYNDDVANNAGKSLIYDLDGNQLGLGSITASDGAADDYFGQSLAVGSGRIVVGSVNAGINASGQVYIYEINGNEVGILTGSGVTNDDFGRSVAVGSGRIVVGAPYNDDVDTNAGKVYLYDIDGNEVGIITASDGAAGDSFGESVAVGSGRIVVGRPNGPVSIYKINETLSDYYDEIVEHYRY